MATENGQRDDGLPVPINRKCPPKSVETSILTYKWSKIFPCRLIWQNMMVNVIEHRQASSEKERLNKSRQEDNILKFWWINEFMKRANKPSILCNLCLPGPPLKCIKTNCYKRFSPESAFIKDKKQVLGCISMKSMCSCSQILYSLEASRISKASGITITRSTMIMLKFWKKKTWE